MKVVCNATPLIHLSAMGQLELLRELFGEISIPDEVYAEVVLQGAGKPGEAEVRNATWIRRCQVSDPSALRTLKAILGEGEAACIILAIAMKADLVILDDRLARLHAQAHDLRITGTIGVLLKAAERGNVDFERALSDLLATGFRLSPQETQRIMNLWQRQRDAQAKPS